MAEQWLDEIYHKSILIEYLKETVELIGRNQIRLAMRIWQEKANKLIQDICQSDDDTVSLMKAALDVAEVWSDQSEFSACMESRLIPAVMEYLSRYGGIDVENDGFVLRSSSTGFLTIYDQRQYKHYHSSYDPMWEAHLLAEEVMDPSISEYAVYGCGLGYFPYQLYSLSGGSVRIRIYETNEQIIGYAKSYGVLGWIPDSSVSIECHSDSGTLIRSFMDGSSHDDVKGVISPWLGYGLQLEYGWRILPYIINGSPEVKYKNIWGINYRKNAELQCASADELLPQIRSKGYKGCAVIAAGPSLDECISFLKDSPKDMMLIAVNTVLKRLLDEGVYPDLVVAVDEMDQMYEHIKGIGERVKEIPLLMHMITNWHYTCEYAGPKFLFQSPSSVLGFGLSAEQGPYYEHMAPTVTSAAIDAGIWLGFRRMYLIGVDLAYPGGKQYASGMPHASITDVGNDNMDVSMDGGQVVTTPTFRKFRDGIERQIASHPEVEVVNMAAHGLLIRGTKKYYQNT